MVNKYIMGSNLEKVNKESTYACTHICSLESLEGTYVACISFSILGEDFTKIKPESFLNAKENCYYKTLKFERRINSFLLGRYTAKKAISRLTGEEDLKKILIQAGVFNQPIVVCNSIRNIQVSLTHSGEFAASIAFDETMLMGIDLERIDLQIKRVLDPVMTRHEKTLANEFPYSYESFLSMLWTIKESLSKVLKTGLTVPLEILEVKNISMKDGYFVSSFSNFSQYITISFIENGYSCSITYPKNVVMDKNINGIKKLVSNALGKKKLFYE